MASSTEFPSIHLPPEIRRIVYEGASLQTGNSSKFVTLRWGTTTPTTWPLIHAARLCTPKNARATNGRTKNERVTIAYKATWSTISLVKSAYTPVPTTFTLPPFAGPTFGADASLVATACRKYTNCVRFQSIRLCRFLPLTMFLALCQRSLK